MQRISCDNLTRKSIKMAGRARMDANLGVREPSRNRGSNKQQIRDDQLANLPESKSDVGASNPNLRSTQWSQNPQSEVFSSPHKPNAKTWKVPQTRPLPSIKKTYRRRLHPLKNVAISQIEYPYSVLTRPKKTYPQ